MGLIDPSHDSGARFFKPSEKRARRSIREAFGVDLARWEPEASQGPFDVLHHRHRAAEVDVPLTDIRNQPFKGRGVELVARPVPLPDDVMDLRPAGVGERLDLFAEDDLARVPDAVD